ncbi:MAG: nucleotidyl transferase AbiEii/AbiGii toxin family protein [Myxococcales bacterium]|nr:MAG: nucleotidyl transferase AbiEii/AbiGii toxin family protein [Myxococcales bacterium]
MSAKNVKNMAASVHAKLLNEARAKGRPFQELLQFYGLERFLYRLAKSKYGDTFVLKGALLLHVWNAPITRPTRDIDLLGFASNSLDAVRDVFKGICDTDVEPDGLQFPSEEVRAGRIKEDARYEGVRVTFAGFLSRSRIPVQVDIGFSDVITPKPSFNAYPTLLQMSAPTLKMYPKETVVAEKFEAMVQLGEINSRMKDFFDLWLLARTFNFDGSLLSDAVRKTFAHRGTKIDLDPVGLSSEFVNNEDTKKKWAAFVKRIQVNDAPSSLSEATPMLRAFLVPIAKDIHSGTKSLKIWKAGGSWT